MSDAVSIFGGIAVLLIVGAYLFSEQIMIYLMVREIRKMAQSIPEKDRVEWFNKAMEGLSKGLSP